jgi:hypothetical protein
MKKFLVLAMALLFAGCATTGEGPKPEYSVGDCLALAPEVAAKVPPQARQMLGVMAFSVSDVGTKYYVIDTTLMGQLAGRAVVEFAQAEQETNKIDCKKPAAKPDELDELDVEAKRRK